MCVRVCVDVCPVSNVNISCGICGYCFFLLLMRLQDTPSVFNLCGKSLRQEGAPPLGVSRWPDKPDVYLLPWVSVGWGHVGPNTPPGAASLCDCCTFWYFYLLLSPPLLRVKGWYEDILGASWAKVMETVEGHKYDCCFSIFQSFKSTCLLAFIGSL